MKTPAFGALPSGKSLEKVKNSKNYIDGEFRNKEKTELLTDTKKTPIKRLLEFAFEKDPEGTVPKIAFFQSMLHLYHFQIKLLKELISILLMIYLR